VTGRVAFVPPRYGAQVLGGAESLCREIALGLVARGWEVDVLTTCAVDHYGWRNDLPAGVAEEDGVTVRRFRAVHDFARPGLRAQRSIEAGVVPPLDDQLSWMSFYFRVPGLFHELLRFGDRYDAIVFMPYMFWTSTVCLPLVAERAVVIPCLHDETYARLDVVRPVLAEPAVAWFLSEPEHQLAHRLGPVAARHQVVGGGMNIPSGYDASGFRERHGIARPFLLYAGRRERDKGWPTLLSMFGRTLALDDHGVDLVTIGVGDAEVPASLSGRVIDLGFLPTEERDNAFAAALAYAQPSRMESFSRSVMESWLAGTPVLAIAQSEVVAWHCERSGGGVTFSDEFDLAQALRWLATAPEEAAAMADRGRRYVLDNYQWSVVLDRMEADLKAMR
jgi:glycosyltransferase involved in cell wall biosynthesis